jgi:hypothetical protein
MSRSFRALLGYVFIQCVAASTLWNPKNLANPMKNPEKCGRTGVLHSAICDPDHIMTEAGKNVLEQVINNASSAEIAVTIIRGIDLEFFHSNDVDSAARLFAQGIHDSVSFSKTLKFT